MQRRLLNIFILISAVAMVARVQAQPPKKDEFDCHLDEITDSYFCNSGPLEGREFVSKSELDDAIEAYKAKQKAAADERAKEVLIPDPKVTAAEEKTEPVKEEPHEPRLKIISWNMKALAGDGSDYDRAALVLGKADVIALQEVDLRGQGKGFVNVIGNLIQAKTQEKICRAWVQSESGERQTYGFLWKDSTVGFVDDGGGIQEVCGDAATIIRQTKKSKLVSQATFYFKPQKKMFVLGTTFMDKKPKAPEKSISEVFKTLDEGKWPIVLAGDLKLSAGHNAFTPVRKLGFRAAVNGNAKGSDTVWYRGAAVTQAGQIDLYKHFADVRREEIKRSFSGIFPVMAEFNLREEPKDTLAIVKKPAQPQSPRQPQSTPKKKSKVKKVASKSKTN